METGKKTSPMALFMFFVGVGVVSMLVYNKLIEPLVDAAWARWNQKSYDRNANIVGDSVADWITPQTSEE